MRINVTGNGRSVEIELRGSSTRKLGKAEAAARRLLDAAPAEKPTLPLGFSATSDTERAADDWDVTEAYSKAR